ncbi:unnamed protein product [Microthlaspi erraticum]|uniref:Uncharacterized protein n=1 Tax=Microthlaspi erraticum TaxID=1685480 RepID=A0A6D2JVA2_9BRAS|nr:unnamed protein product [Microthlaspi erraticum]
MWRLERSRRLTWTRCQRVRASSSACKGNAATCCRNDDTCALWCQERCIVMLLLPCGSFTEKPSWMDRKDDSEGTWVVPMAEYYTTV